MRKLKKGFWLPLISLCFTAASVSAQVSKSSVTANKDVNFPVSSTASEENYLNTITTTGPDGVRYKLVQIGDRLPKLFVNNKLVRTEEMDRYGSLIQNLKPILWQRQKEAARERAAYDIHQQDAIINDILKDQLAKSSKDVLSFELSADDFIINGKTQSFSIFSRYMKKYIKNNDKVYQFNYSN